VPPHVVKERLGHSNISITLDLYSHVFPSMEREAASKAEQVLRVAVGE
jgi:integrase